MTKCNLNNEARDECGHSTGQDDCILSEGSTCVLFKDEDNENTECGCCGSMYDGEKTKDNCPYC